MDDSKLAMLHWKFQTKYHMIRNDRAWQMTSFGHTLIAFWTPTAILSCSVSECLWCFVHLMVKKTWLIFKVHTFFEWWSWWYGYITRNNFQSSHVQRLVNEIYLFKFANFFVQQRKYNYLTCLKISAWWRGNCESIALPYHSWRNVLCLIFWSVADIQTTSAHILFITIEMSSRWSPFSHITTHTSF